MFIGYRLITWTVPKCSLPFYGCIGLSQLCPWNNEYCFVISDSNKLRVYFKTVLYFGSYLICVIHCWTCLKTTLNLFLCYHTTNVYVTVWFGYIKTKLRWKLLELIDWYNGMKFIEKDKAWQVISSFLCHLYKQAYIKGSLLLCHPLM